MKIDLHNSQGERVAWVEVDADSPQRVVQAVNAEGHEEEHYLEWEAAFDDEGRLRKCPVCQCNDLYTHRNAPQLLGFIIVLAVGLICLGLWGLTDAPLALVLGVLGVVVVAQLLLMVFSGRFIGCYRCGSKFHNTPIPRRLNAWDTLTAEKYRGERPLETS
ncbi:MAG: hypothetical protein GC159_04200 [Phycisphaera sp.]|nr:hypothetical protein [Phycisphaera sp.]